MQLLLISLFLLITLYCVTSAQEEAVATFNPLCEDISFKAIFKLETFENGSPLFLSEIHEQYDHRLGAASVWETKSFAGEEESIERRRFVYLSTHKHDIEIKATGGSESLIKDAAFIQMPSIPGVGLNSNLQHIAAERFGAEAEKVRMMYSEIDSLDGELLKINTKSGYQFSLDLGPFFGKDCLEKVESKLEYIRGLSRLLELIECRREEFKLTDAAQISGPDVKSRGQAVAVYAAKELKPLHNFGPGKIDKLTITVSVPAQDGRGIYKRGQELPERSLPISMSLEFEPNTRIIINIYQFEVMDVSELYTSANYYLLPLARGLDNQLMAHLVAQNLIEPTQSEFYFRGKLTKLLKGDSPSSGIEEIHLSVVYDLQHEILAQHSNLNGVSQRAASRLLYDLKTGLKYHTMLFNEDYEEPLGGQQGDKWKWNSCVMDSITAEESHVLESGGDFEALDVRSAAHMGYAQVRGVRCSVYERQLFSIPIWIERFLPKIEEHQQLHVTIYAAQESGKLMRLEFNLLQYDDQYKGIASEGIFLVNPKLIASFQLELYMFQFASNLSDDEIDDALRQVGQSCVFARRNSRWFDLDLELQVEELGTNSVANKLFYQLNQNDHLLKHSIEVSLSQALGLSYLQMADLAVRIIKSNSHIDVSLTIYDVPKQSLLTQFLGSAQDLAKGMTELDNWKGEPSASLDECKWRAAHLLNEAQSKRVFMFCPATSHCVLAAAAGVSASLQTRKEQTIDMFIGPKLEQASAEQNKCHLYSIELQLTRSQSGKQRYTSKWISLLNIFIERNNKEKLKQKPLEIKFNPKAEEKLVLSLVKLRVSPGTGVDEENLWPIKDIGFDSSQMEDDLKREVFSPSECSQSCLMRHDCQSFSVCNLGSSRYECIRSKVNWTAEEDVNELRRIGGASSKQVPLPVKLRDGSQAIVPLRRSLLCSMYKRQHLHLFKLKVSEPVLLAPNDSGSNLMALNSSDECASFCLNRARVMLSLRPEVVRLAAQKEQPTGRDLACNSFRYSQDLQLCELMPRLHLRPDTSQTNIAARETGSEWMRWLAARVEANAQMQQINNRSLGKSSDFDTYEINYARLFEGRSGRHLELKGPEYTTFVENGVNKTVKWLDHYSDTSAIECAKLCYEWNRCQSFDVMSPFKSSGTNVFYTETCILHTRSVTNLTGDGQSYRLVASNSGGINWWHYEPNDLARYAMHADFHDQNESSNDIFI